MPSTTLTIDQIDISPLNVRTYRPDAEDTETLQASILAEGLLNAIDVHEMRGPRRPANRRYGAVAGGRRTRAIKALVARGALPADWPVPVNLHEGLTDAELIELSITENLIRRDLREHELFAGVARAAAKGHNAEQIARGLGQPDSARVRKWLRLGQLAKPVFDALAAGRIDVDQASAYAATEDQELQAATFARLADEPTHNHTAQRIRAAMKIGDLETTKLLHFVGEEAYRDAGGRFELDLFAEEADQRGRVVDEGKLHELVQQKMNAVRDEVRVTTQTRDLRFVVDPPQSEYGYADYQLSISPKRGEGGSLILPEGDVVAHIKIDKDGEPEVSYWWASRKAKFGSEKPRPTTPIGDAIGDSARFAQRKEADAAIKEEAGLSQDAIQILRSMRRSILRTALVRDADTRGDVARDYLVWAQLRLLIGEYRTGRVGMGRIGTEGIGGIELAARARKIVDASGVSGPVADALQELGRQTFVTADDLGEAFLDFRASDDRLKNLAAAIVAGLALDRSLAAPGYQLPVHEALASAMPRFAEDSAVRDNWQPTADLLALSPKGQRIGLAEGLVDEATRQRWATLKNDEVTDRVLDAVKRSPSWVHPLLRFDVSGAIAARASQSEAAE